MESPHHFSSKSDCNGTAVAPFFSCCVRLFQQSHLFLNGEVLTCNDVKKSFHNICQILGNCQCKMTFGFHVGSNNFCNHFPPEHYSCCAQCNNVTLGSRPPIQPSAVGDRSLMWPYHITGTPGCSTPLCSVPLTLHPG